MAQTRPADAGGVLDHAAQTVVDRLRSLAKAQRGGLVRHYAARVPAYLRGLPVHDLDRMRFFDDKVIPLSAAQGELLYVLARTGGARRIVEFGTSFGVSTIYLAAAVRDAGAGGEVVGTEVVPRKAAAAERSLAEAGLAAWVELRTGDARDTLASLEGPVDLLLLDGWPALAGEVLDLVEPRLARGAVVVVDNATQFRRELGPVARRLSGPRYARATLPLAGGMLVAVARD